MSMNNEPYMMDDNTQQKSVRDAIDDYITEGINITKSSQYGVHAGTKEQLEKGVPIRYSIWKDGIEQFLKNHDFRDESEFFSEADDVPIIIGGLAYGDPQSPETLLLMNKIKLATSKKILVLKDVRRKINAVETRTVDQTFKKVDEKNKEKVIRISVYGGTLIVNESTGFVKLNKVGDILNLAGQEFRAILTLAKNDGHQATYTELIGGNDTKNKRRTLGFSLRNLKETLGILPKKSAKNKDIIGNIKKYGYRLKT